jgi:hypothetical protein
MELTRDEKIMCAAIAKLETLTDGQRASFYEMADRRTPAYAQMMRVPVSDWPQPFQDEVTRARDRQARKERS